MPWKECSVKPSLTRIAFSDFISYSFIKPNGRRLTRTTAGVGEKGTRYCSALRSVLQLMNWRGLVCEGAKTDPNTIAEAVTTCPNVY